MTEVRFYFNTPDRLRAACVITGKAVAQGHRVLVFAPDAGTARSYDQLLWSLQAESFIPHVPADSPLAARTPVLITTRLAEPPHDDLLLNLAEDLPAGFDHFRQLVEIVADDEAGRAAARARWRLYKERGFNVTPHDMSPTRRAEP